MVSLHINCLICGTELVRDHNDLWGHQQLRCPKCVPVKRPYNLNHNSRYMAQLLTGGQWRTIGISKPDLKKFASWKEQIEQHNNSYRIRIQLLNGQWFSAFCASMPYEWLCSSIKYLKAVEDARNRNDELLKQAKISFKDALPKGAIGADTDGYYIVRDGQIVHISI